MSEGGQRGTGNDNVLYLFFCFYSIIPHGAVRGLTEQTLVRLLEELVKTEMALNSCPG